MSAYNWFSGTKNTKTQRQFVFAMLQYALATNAISNALTSRCKLFSSHDSTNVEMNRCATLPNGRIDFRIINANVGNVHIGQRAPMHCTSFMHAALASVSCCYRHSVVVVIDAATSAISHVQYSFWRTALFWASWIYLYVCVRTPARGQYNKQNSRLDLCAMHTYRIHDILWEYLCAGDGQNAQQKHLKKQSCHMARWGYCCSYCCCQRFFFLLCTSNINNENPTKFHTTNIQFFQYIRYDGV